MSRISELFLYLTFIKCDLQGDFQGVMKFTIHEIHIRTDPMPGDMTVCGAFAMLRR